MSLRRGRVDSLDVAPRAETSARWLPWCGAAGLGVGGERAGSRLADVRFRGADTVGFGADRLPSGADIRRLDLAFGTQRRHSGPNLAIRRPDGDVRGPDGDVRRPDGDVRAGTDEEM